MAIHVPRDWRLGTWDLGETFLASMSPGTGALELGIWGNFSWPSMSPGTGALELGIWGNLPWPSMSPGTGALELGIWGKLPWPSMSPGTGASVCFFFLCFTVTLILTAFLSVAFYIIFFYFTATG
jgi:hypothetical protein